MKQLRRGLQLTLVALFLDLELSGEVLVLLPLDLRADGAIIEEVAREADLGPVDVGLGEDLVLEVVVGAEVEVELESRLALDILSGVRVVKVLDLDVGEALQSIGVAIGNQLANAQVVAEGGEPEFRDTRRGSLNILGESLIVLVLFQLSLLAKLDLLLGRGLGARDNGLATLVQRLGKA